MNAINQGVFGNKNVAHLTYNINGSEAVGDTVVLGEMGATQKNTYLEGVVKSCGSGCLVDIGIRPIDSETAENQAFFIEDADVQSNASVKIEACSTWSVELSHQITLTFKGVPTANQKIELLLDYIHA